MEQILQAYASHARAIASDPKHGARAEFAELAAAAAQVPDTHYGAAHLCLAKAHLRAAVSRAFSAPQQVYERDYQDLLKSCRAAGLRDRTKESATSSQTLDLLDSKLTKLASNNLVLESLRSASAEAVTVVLKAHSLQAARLVAVIFDTVQHSSMREDSGLKIMRGHVQLVVSVILTRLSQPAQVPLVFSLVVEKLHVTDPYLFSNLCLPTILSISCTLQMRFSAWSLSRHDMITEHTLGERWPWEIAGKQPPQQYQDLTLAALQSVYRKYSDAYKYSDRLLDLAEAGMQVHVVKDIKLINTKKFSRGHTLRQLLLIMYIMCSYVLSFADSGDDMLDWLRLPSSARLLGASTLLLPEDIQRLQVT